MLLKNKKIAVNKILAYTFAICLACALLQYKKNNSEIAVVKKMDNLQCDISSPHKFTMSFLELSSEDKSYNNLLEIHKKFYITFPEALPKQKDLFEAYYYAALSGRHPNLYKKLGLLQDALDNLDANINLYPTNYDFRIARIVIHRNLPAFFRDSAKIREDVKFLMSGYTDKKIFEFDSIENTISREDLYLIDCELHKYQLDI